MDETRAAQERWNQAADAWNRFADGEDVNRTLLLDPVMLDFAGDVRGRRVLDVGCGEGRFSRLLAERGACTIGVDPTIPLIRYAGAKSPQLQWIGGAGEALPFASASFDLVVCYLVLIDIAGFRQAIAEMARVLRPGGALLIANLQSFATTRPRAWYQDERGQKIHVAVEDYFDERPISLSWAGIEITNWHRPFEAYLDALLSSGLRLRRFTEPRPRPEAVAMHPRMEDEFRVPIFHVMLWERDDAP